ncbi:MAG TPA: DUF882 domain-containing protein [Vineibacter sp.]|nr:DUF882 domain-containing protein [Vineibacter sp.]
MTDGDAPAPDRSVPGLRAESDLRLRPSMATTAHGGLRRRAALAGLTGIAAGALCVGVPTPANGPAVVLVGARGGSGTRFLSLVAAHTGETFAGGEPFDEQKLARLNRLLRDYSSGEVKPIDPALFTLLSRIHAEVGLPLRVLSGFRSWRNNRFMRLVGYDVAENSQHVAGKAVDFTVAGIAASKLGEIAHRCGAGGIGVYRSGFVHVDTGPQRQWTGE